MAYRCKKCQSGNIKIDITYAYHDIYNCQDCNYIGYIKIVDCCRKPFSIITIYHYSFDKRPLYSQCLNCFGADKTKPLKAKDYSEQIRAEFNQFGFEDWKADRKNEGNEIYDGIKQDNYKNSERYRYHQYLLSPEWKAKRKLILIRDSNTCQFCKTSGAVEVHHLHYDNLFNEQLEDLRATCLDCHHLIHNKSRNSVNP